MYSKYYWELLGRKLSPTPPANKLSIETANDNDEKETDEADPAEMKLLLELNEQVTINTIHFNVNKT